MPPKKKSKTAAVPAPLPLDGCIVALSGTFPGSSQSALEKEYINPLGATLAKSITSTTSHLITTESDFAKPSTKVKQAQGQDTHIVKLGWLTDCFDQSTRLSEDAYSFGSADPTNGTSSSNNDIPSRKRSVTATLADDQNQDDDADKEEKPNKKSKGASASKVQAVVEGEINIATSKDINISIDEGCPLASYRVYIADDGLIYDAALNQTNAGHNNNKFYRIQVSLFTFRLAVVYKIVYHSHLTVKTKVYYFYQRKRSLKYILRSNAYNFSFRHFWNNVNCVT